LIIWYNLIRLCLKITVTTTERKYSYYLCQYLHFEVNPCPDEHHERCTWQKFSVGNKFSIHLTNYTVLREILTSHLVKHPDSPNKVSCLSSICHIYLFSHVPLGSVNIIKHAFTKKHLRNISLIVGLIRLERTLANENRIKL